MKRCLAAAIAGIVLLVLGVAPAADAGRLRGYISKLHVSGLGGTGTGKVFIYTAVGGFCGVAVLTGISSGVKQVAFESARASLLAQAPGALQHYTGWFIPGGPGLCPGIAGEASGFYFYHKGSFP